VCAGLVGLYRRVSCIRLKLLDAFVLKTSYFPSLEDLGKNLMRWLMLRVSGFVCNESDKECAWKAL